MAPPSLPFSGASVLAPPQVPPLAGDVQLHERLTGHVQPLIQVHSGVGELKVCFSHLGSSLEKEALAESA